jgi:hypothetical protein
LVIMNIKAFVLVSLVVVVDSFTISSVASRRSATQLRSSSSFQSDGGVSSGLISNLAELALKLRLKGQTGVKFDVSANPSDLLLKGRVGPVTVKGRGWQSQLGLSCRAIEATIDTCELDIGRIMSNQKLVLTTPAKGEAMIALNSADFGNFITHPLMKPPELQNKNNEALVFLKEDIVVDPVSATVTFFGSYMGEKWRLTLARGEGEQRALVTVALEGNTETESLAAISAELSRAISDFFNAMVFEIDGTWLTFQDMMVTAKGAAPSLMLQLKITVRKFPSPGLEF